MRRLIAVQLLILLMGCDPTLPGPVIQKNIMALKGKPITAAVAILGAPARQELTATGTVYVWFATKIEWSSEWQISRRDITGANTEPQAGERLLCTMKIFTDSAQSIIDSDFYGAYGACAYFASAMDESYHWAP